MRKTIAFSGRRRKVFAYIAKYIFFADIIMGFSLMMPTRFWGSLSHGGLIGLIICIIINNYIIKPST